MSRNGRDLQSVERTLHSELDTVEESLSPWALSALKRCFDCVCVLAFLPLLVPVFLLIGLAVRCTSSGPVLFLQKRMGRYGRTFTIFKFRTMCHVSVSGRSAVTTVGNQIFTPVGPFLRRFKLDEIPQLFNVLRGDMSLVGPRPKLPEHQLSILNCRPGITGAATLAFAREEQFLARLPKDKLDEYYYSVVLPAKHRLDAEYMSRATFFSDVRLIIDSAVRRWDSSTLAHLLSQNRVSHIQVPVNFRLSDQATSRLTVLAHDKSFAQAD